MSTIAVVFDFDDTLVPDSTTLLLEEHSVDTFDFWKSRVGEMVENGWDPSLAWLNCFLELVGEGNELGLLNNRSLHDFGETLDAQLYSGLPQLFADLKDITSEFQDISVEFYIVSGGLQEVINGSSIVRKHFSGVYGCIFEENGDPPILTSIKRSISFTEKTRYLFEISKGLSIEETSRNPFSVNKDIPLERRRIPFQNMIYVGDGLTDVPCFSLVKKSGGIPFGVFDPTNSGKAKRALMEFLKPGRVISCHSPKYGPDEDLGALLRAAVSSRCSQIFISQQSV